MEFKMKQFRLATSVLISASLFSSIVFADTVMKDLPLSTTAPFNWTGFYGGLNIGAVRHTMNITDNQATSFNATIEQVANPGLTAGFQVGYRRQTDLTHVSGVYGVELSANLSNLTFDKEYGSPFSLYQLEIKNELKNLCLLQLTAGIAADKTLLFLAAGLSWTNLTGSVTDQSGAPFFNSFNINQKVLGTALGAGAEYALSEKFSLRFKVDVITPNQYSVSNSAGDTFQISNSVVQGTLGLNYKFG
jgi:opacity protein-like surface antigen